MFNIIYHIDFIYNVKNNAKIIIKPDCTIFDFVKVNLLMRYY